MNENWAVIINPVAGKKRGVADWPAMNSLFEAHRVPVTAFISEKKSAPRQMTLDLISNGYRKFIAVGGDGTMNELADAMLAQSHVPSHQLTLAQVAAGTGNDWQRMYSINNTYEEAARRISNGNTFLQDAGCIEYQGINGQTEKRYFVNAAGIGFDALVIKKVNSRGAKGETGKMVYLYTLFTSLLKSRHYPYKIMTDSVVIEGDVFNITIGIGKFSGGGMMFLPDSLPDDGLFDMTIIGKISKRDVIRNIKNIYDGSFIKHSSVKLYKSEFVHIEAKGQPGIEVDGEFIGYTPAKFQIIPKCLKVII